MAQGKRYEITVVPKATLLADQSDPGTSQFVFSYTITITNTGDIAAQLVSRHWIITDAEHKVQEVKGLGVVGQRRGRTDLRCADSALHAVGTAHPSLNVVVARRRHW